MNTILQTNKTIKLQKPALKDITSIIDVQRIFQGKNKIKLIHEGKKYVLQITSNNKLLLTK